MEFTPRIKQILQIVLAADEPVLEQEIADRIGVSKRTVQREFDYIENGLRDYHLELRKKKNAGVSIAGDSIDLNQLKEDIGKLPEEAIGDKTIRRKYLICELLRERIPKKLFYFSDLFGVSEATVSKDLEVVSRWFGDNHIEVVRRPGYGVTLEGSEMHYRAAVQRFINENVDDESIRSLLLGKEQAMVTAIGNYGSKNIYELLNSEILGRVSSTFQKMEEPRLRQMTDDSYIGLMLHITIAIDRIQKGEIIQENTSSMAEYELDEDFVLAESIIKKLEAEFELTIPEGEMVYVLLHIKGSKMTYSVSGNQQYIGMENMLDLVDQMVDAFDQPQSGDRSLGSSEAAYELKCDEEFIHGLMMHLEPTMVRLQNDMNIYNPLLEQVKEEYPDVFQRCKNAAAVMERVTGYQVSDAEVGFLTMHFGAALVRIQERKETRRTVAIGVICASGFGVARLMMTKIKNSLKKDVALETYGRDEITPYIASRMDFFVSSLNLEEMGVDYVKVSPLVTANDLMMIRTKVEEYSHMPARQEDTDFTRQLDQINQTAMEIKNLIRRYQNYRIPAHVDLEEMISSISLKVTDNPRAAALLRADLMAREQIMTQIFPELQFALFHSKTKAVKDNVFYTITPENGSCFYNQTLHGIRGAVLLLMPQNSDGMRDTEILGHISSAFVEDDTFLKTIFEGDEERIREKLQKTLKAFFNEYISQL